MTRVIALVGLSGVGKSTLLGRVQALQPLIHLQASDLIKAEQARRRSNVSSSEELRLGPVLHNQQLLVDGFIAATEGFSGLVVFDGHAVIFVEDSATEIPSSVFDALGCAAIVMIEADPAIIRAQRLRDAARIRPDINEAGLGRQQAYAKSVAAKIAEELKILFRCVAAGDCAGLLATLVSLSEDGRDEDTHSCGA